MVFGVGMVVSKELIVSDVNILIDFYETEPKLLRILCSEFTVKVPQVVLDKVEQISNAKAQELGMEVVDTEYLSIERQGIGRLSFQDKMCAELAIDLNASCLTNDKLLKNTIENEGLKAYWAMQMILLFVERGLLDKTETFAIADRIFASNPWLRKIEESFREKLNHS